MSRRRTAGSPHRNTAVCLSLVPFHVVKLGHPMTHMIANCFEASNLRLMMTSSLSMACLAVVVLMTLDSHCIGADSNSGNTTPPATAGEQGGKVSATFQLRVLPMTDPKTGVKHEVDAAALASAEEVLGRRLATAQIRTVRFLRQPPDHIRMHGDAMTPAQVGTLRQCVVQAASLDFRVVHPDSEKLLAELEAKNALPDSSWNILPMKESKPGEKPRRLIVRSVPNITGDQITEAYPAYDSSGWFIGICFDKKGGATFFEITRQMRKFVDRFAIVLDGNIISAPTTAVEGGIASNSCIITGKFTEKEARDFANVVKNPLKNPIVVEVETVR